jgi:cation transport ATPase
MGTLWMAVLADMGASLLVTLYGTRLLKWRGEQRDEQRGSLTDAAAAR